MTHNEDFERLTAPLRAEMVGYCYRMAGSADEAEDLTQQTCLRGSDDERQAPANQVLEIADGQIGRIVMFLDAGLFRALGPPRTVRSALPERPRPARDAGGIR